MFISYFLFVLGLITLPLSATKGKLSDEDLAHYCNKYIGYPLSVEHKSKLYLGGLSGYSSKTGRFELSIDIGDKDFPGVVYVTPEELSNKCTPLPSAAEQDRAVRKLYKSGKADVVKYRDVIQLADDSHKYGKIMSSLHRNRKTGGFKVKVLFKNGEESLVDLLEDGIIIL